MGNQTSWAGWGSLSRQQQGSWVQGCPQQNFTWAWRDPWTTEYLHPVVPLSSAATPAHTGPMATHLLKIRTKHVLTASRGYKILSYATVSASFLLTMCKYFVCVYRGEHCSKNRPGRVGVDTTPRRDKSPNPPPSTGTKAQRHASVPTAALCTTGAAWGSLQNRPQLSPGLLKHFSAFWCRGPVGFNRY